MSKTDEAYNRLVSFEGRLRATRGSFISALRVAYGRTDGEAAALRRGYDALDTAIAKAEGREA